MRKLLFIIVSTVIFSACVRNGKNHAVLDEADSLNRNYIPLASDSLLKEATAYFDSHGTPNKRLRAHYLLGCAYRDMGESPRAIETWHDAVNCADTTATDCDYKTLGKKGENGLFPAVFFSLKELGKRGIPSLSSDIPQPQTQSDRYIFDEETLRIYHKSLRDCNLCGF